jgi:hypothetical protein
MQVFKPLGEQCLFTGGNEDTPMVEVVMSNPHPLSTQKNAKVLRIEQNGQSVQVSMDTLSAILAWAGKP